MTAHRLEVRFDLGSDTGLTGEEDWPSRDVEGGEWLGAKDEDEDQDEEHDFFDGGSTPSTGVWARGVASHSQPSCRCHTV